MVGVLILTHGGMADELLEAARKITPCPLERFEALTLEWDEEPESARVRLQAAVERLEDGDGVLILADIFGGTPFNTALPLLDDAGIQMVSGVNLPMVVRLGCLGRQEMAVDELAEWICGKAQESILTGSRVPRPGELKRSRC